MENLNNYKNEIRECRICWEKFIPTWPIMYDCKKCLNEKIIRCTKNLIELNKRVTWYNEFASEYKKTKISIEKWE